MFGKEKNITQKLYEDRIRKLENENKYLKNQIELYKKHEEKTKELNDEYKDLIKQTKEMQIRVRKQLEFAEELCKEYKGEFEKRVKQIE